MINFPVIFQVWKTLEDNHQLHSIQVTSNQVCVKLTSIQVTSSSNLRQIKMSGPVNKSSGPLGPATTDLLCNSNPFGTGFPSAASMTAATAYADSAAACFVKTGPGSSGQAQQLLLKPLASFHCYDNGHYQLFQHQAASMDWQIHQTSSSRSM